MKAVQSKVVGFLVLVACVSTVSAGTLGIVSAPTGEQQMMENWSRLTIAGSYQFQEREVWLENGDPANLKVRQALAHVGIDVCDWLTLTAAIGASDPSVEDGASLDDRTTVYGYGFRTRLVGHEVTGPELLAGKWGIQLETQYLYHEADAPSKTLDWREWLVDLQLRYELFAFGMGEDTDKYPYSTVFYVGPTWSHINGEFDSRQHAGVITGVDIYLTHDLAIGAELQAYEKATAAFKLSYHF